MHRARGQLDWLKCGLSAGTARWHLVGTSVRISPVAAGSVPAHVRAHPGRGDRRRPGEPEVGRGVGTHPRRGRRCGRPRRWRRLAPAATPANAVAAAFTSPGQRGAGPPPEPGTARSGGDTGPQQYVVTSVTSDNLDDILGVPPQTLSPVAAAANRAANRHVRWVDLDAHGYAVLDITAERAQMDYFALSDRADPAATSAPLRSYRTRAGQRRVERADGPVA